MDTSGLRAAYERFVAEATAGGFAPPPDGGWFAERVVAHVTVNDGLLAAVADRLLTGEPAAYDNAPAIDEHALDRFAHALGGWTALVAAARRSGGDLCDALDRLSDEQAATLVPARIVDGGVVVLDASVPWAGLMGAQEHRHVLMHTEQLRALRAVPAAG